MIVVHISLLNFDHGESFVFFLIGKVVACVPLAFQHLLLVEYYSMGTAVIVAHVWGTCVCLCLARVFVLYI